MRTGNVDLASTIATEITSSIIVNRILKNSREILT